MLPIDGLRLIAAGTVAVSAFSIAAEVTGLYRSWRGNSAEDEARCIVATWAITVVMLLTIAFLTRYTDLAGRKAFCAWFLAAPVFLVAHRLAVRRVQSLLRGQGWNVRRYAIVGANDLGIQLARNIEQAPGLGLRLVGFFDDRNSDRNVRLPGDVGSMAGTIGELVEQARAGEVDCVYLALPMRAVERIRGVLQELSDTTASVYIVPDFFVFQLLHSRWSTIGGLPAVSVYETPFYGPDGLLKRAFDLIAGSLLLILLAAPMAAVAAAIKLTSRGPAFFRQRRYGMDGREFRVWKFRTMTVCEDGPLVRQATQNDQRVTTIGKLLRKTSLDELPQLFNVIEGTMSLVGPRPHASAHNEQYRKLISGYMLRHKVKPGLTGLAQVRGWRGETDTLEKMQRRIECDHEYIREWSLWLDIKILLRTPLIVLSAKNAY
ncbi:MAG: undecaprenyl-phosphate glucose phosphotransferase [Planctomycetes bacterium]|nr:undecaprenyl-phosphate glucose phosphotransferase [Planctomycetota bacterium]